MNKLAYLTKVVPLDEMDKADRENLEDIHATMDESDGYAFLGDSYTDHMWDDSVQWAKTGYTRINFALVHKAMDDANPNLTGTTDSSHVSVIDDDPVRWDGYHNSNTMGESVNELESDEYNTDSDIAVAVEFDRLRAENEARHAERNDSDNLPNLDSMFPIVLLLALMTFGAFMGIADHLLMS